MPSHRTTRRIHHRHSRSRKIGGGFFSGFRWIRDTVSKMSSRFKGFSLFKSKTKNRPQPNSGSNTSSKQNIITIDKNKVRVVGRVNNGMSPENIDRKFEEQERQQREELKQILDVKGKNGNNGKNGKTGKNGNLNSNLRPPYNR